MTVLQALRAGCVLALRNTGSLRQPVRRMGGHAAEPSMATMEGIRFQISKIKNALKDSDTHMVPRPYIIAFLMAAPIYPLWNAGKPTLLFKCSKWDVIRTEEKESRLIGRLE